MPLKTPKFWYPQPNSKPSCIEYILRPISFIYQSVHQINKSHKKTKKAPLPVICVGNITAGGSGKTPVCIALAKLLADKGREGSAFLTRGYGSKKAAPRVVKVHEGAKQVGDEPIMLSNYAKTIVSVDRYKGACLAHSEDAKFVIMDDGLINTSIRKDITFLVIDGSVGFGNKKTIPAGPLREDWKAGVRQADHVILIGDDNHNVKSLIPSGKKIFKANVRAQAEHINKTAQYVAFSGISLPQKFKDTLGKERIEVIKFYEFPDHHLFTEKEIKNINNYAKKHHAKIITTEKDYVRLDDEQKKEIEFISISIEFEKPEEILEAIDRVLK